VDRGRPAVSARIRSLRPPRPAVDPWTPLGTTIEDELGPDGRLLPALTVFLAGSECPFTCVFCDLWRHTLEGPTPEGALPAQLRQALESDAVRGARPPHVKLYNASNFFEPRAVPPSDLPALAALLQPFARVTVESHPNLTAPAAEFARRLPGRLEVAMGLETIHPSGARLNKACTPDDFARAAAALREDGIGVRAFVLLGAPFVPAAEAVEWAVRSAEWALAHGAEVVALIPVRGGNGILEELAAAGAFTPPKLADLERALEASLAPEKGVVLADLWDAERLDACPRCRGARLSRLLAMTRSGRPGPPLLCGACSPAASG